MSKKVRKVIDRKIISSRLPTFELIVFWLFLDRLSAPGWLFGVVFTFLGMMWIVSLILLFTEERINPFEEA